MKINLLSRKENLVLKQVEDWVLLPAVLLDLDRMLCSFHWMGKCWGILYSLWRSREGWQDYLEVLSLVMHRMVWWSNGTWCHISPLLCCYSWCFWMADHCSTLVLTGQHFSHYSVEINVQHTIRLGWCSWPSWLSVQNQFLPVVILVKCIVAYDS